MPPTEATTPTSSATEASPLVAPETLRTLARINPWVPCAHIALEWAAIAGAIALCQYFWNPLLFVVTVLFIGARQHALIILMHDAAHHRMFADRRLNDTVANVLLAWPVFVDVAEYRQTHLAHHAHLNTERDPNWARKTEAQRTFPQSPRRLLALFGPLALGYSLWLNTRAVLGSVWRRERPNPYRLALYAVVLAVIAWYGAWLPLILYWLLPAHTWLPVVAVFRERAEHSATANRHPLNHSRTVLAGWLDRLFVASKNVNYHIEHHLYPGVPFYRLPQLHAAMRAHPNYLANAHVTRGYMGALRELAGKSPEGPLKGPDGSKPLGSP
jgi:fatty acid desaturase